jgi:hypothetical protein
MVDKITTQQQKKKTTTYKNVVKFNIRERLKHIEILRTKKLQADYMRRGKAYYRWDKNFI